MKKSTNIDDIKVLPKVEWPAGLSEMPDPPKQMYFEGKLPAADYAYLTVVGSRRNSTYGREVTEHLIAGLAGQKIAIISGLAVGTDTVAHRAALSAKLPTVAVPGSGLSREVIHPPSNRELANEIVWSGGALLSELPATAPAGLHTFPRRNRIMAALSQAILIIEAGEKSGTLITARLGLDYNREICAVPGPIFSQNSAGTNRLIREGATLVRSSDDVLQALGLANGQVGEQGQLDFSALSDLEKQIVELLSIENLPRDELIRATALSAQEVNVTLTSMEIKGLVKELAGEFRLVN